MKLIDRMNLFMYVYRYRNNPEYNTIKKILSNNYNKIVTDIEEGAEYTENFITNADGIRKALLIRECMDNGLSINMLINKKYTAAQLENILCGLQDGLTEVQIKQYARPEYSSAQMLELRKGFISLPEDKVDFFKDPDFSAKQMVEIRTAIEQKVPESVIKRIASPELHYSVMRAAIIYINESQREKTKIAIKNKDNENYETPANIYYTKSSNLDVVLDKLKYASTYVMRYGIQNGLEPERINYAIEKMSVLQQYWDRELFRDIGKEIVDEIIDNNIKDLDKYFETKFIVKEEKEDQIQTEFDTEAEYVVEKKEETTEVVEKKEVFNVIEYDEELKKKLEEQPIRVIFDDAEDKEYEDKPTVAIQF